MKFYVGVTDNDWFDFLAQRQPDEANFWRPGRQGLRAIEQWAPFLFKLHSPLNYVAGGGFFVRYLRLPLSIAWEAFGEKNGASSYQDLYNQILKYRPPEPDPDIGCIILAQPFFFEEQDWIPQPSDWSPNLVSGRSYDTGDPIGASLWSQIQERFERIALLSAQDEETVPLVAEPSAHYGSEYLVQPRLGQGPSELWLRTPTNDAAR